jgi:hypothetical protein
VNFFIFWHNKICVGPTSIVTSLSSPRCRPSSDRRHHIAVSCHASFPWSQDDLAVSALSSGNTSSRHLPSRVKTEALNSHHRRWSPSSDIPIFTLRCYKNVISTLATLFTTQPCLYFTSSLARAPHHPSTRRHSFSLPSHFHHHPSIQRHSR